jgi:hypothetical protein
MSCAMDNLLVRLPRVMSGLGKKTWRFGLSYLIMVCACAANPYGPAAAEEADSTFRFEDDFIGKTLHPDWSIQNEDPDRWTLLDDDYMFLISTSGSTNVLRLKHDIPSDFEIEARVNGTFAYGQCFYLRLEQDNENYINLIVCGYGDIRFTKSQGGSETSFSESIGKGTVSYGLKLRRSGPEITGYYSKGGEGGWVEIGDHYFIEFESELSLAAWNNNTNTPEGGFRLDYVKVSELE